MVVAAPIALPPHGLIRVRGALRVRRTGWVFDLGRLTCPDAHRIKGGFRFIREDGCLECTHKDRAGATVCGALVYVNAAHDVHLVRRLFACDVTKEEARRFEAERFTIERVLHYCGATFPGQEPPV